MAAWILTLESIGLLKSDFDAHAGALIALRARVPGALGALEPQADRRAVAAQVAPPHLALGPQHGHGHDIAVALVPDREGVLAAGLAPGDRDERQAPAGDRMQRRAQEQLED